MKQPQNKRKALATIAKTENPKPELLSIPADAVSAPAEQHPQNANTVDLLTAAEINTAPITDTAKAEGLGSTNAYANKRISELSQRDIMAKTLKIKQEARKRGYKLERLAHDPAALQAALDDFDLTCFDLGLYPLQNLLAVWLNCISQQIVALSSAANVSEAGELLAAHNDYCISLISSAAMQSEKPPVFSIYYLKSAYKMYDNNFNAGSGVVFNGVGGASITQNITINAADISKKSEIFGEIDAQALPEGANS